MGDWSMLPSDILGAIALKLDQLEDLVYFSAVCRSWNHASSQVKSIWNPDSLMPWLFLVENTNDNPNCFRKVYNHSKKKHYRLKVPETFGARCWGSSHGWIALQTFDYQLHLFNPLTKARVTTLPSVLTMSNPTLEPNNDPPPNPDLEPNDPLEEHQHWFPAQEPPIIIEPPDDPLERQQWYFGCFVMRVIVLKMSSHDGGGGDLLIAAIFRDKIESSALALARPGDESWTYVVSGAMDVACLEGQDRDRIYILCLDGQVLYCDIGRGGNLEDIKVMEYAPGIILKLLWAENLYLLDKLYLLDLCGKLVMVVRRKQRIETYLTTSFDVYMLDENKKWVEIKDIGNFSIFVGHHSSMACRTTAANRNCIYFTDDEFTWWRKKYLGLGGDDIGFYNLDSKLAYDYYFKTDVLSPFCPAILFMPR